MNEILSFFCSNLKYIKQRHSKMIPQKKLSFVTNSNFQKDSASIWTFNFIKTRSGGAGQGWFELYKIVFGPWSKGFIIILNTKYLRCLKCLVKFMTFVIFVKYWIRYVSFNLIFKGLVLTPLHKLIF